MLSTIIILIHLEGTWGRFLPGADTRNSVDCEGHFSLEGNFAETTFTHCLVWRQAHKRKCLKGYSELGRARTSPKIVESHVIDS